jgi:hypothetical protein
MGFAVAFHPYPVGLFLKESLRQSPTEASGECLMAAAVPPLDLPQKHPAELSTGLTIEIGGIPIFLESNDAEFRRLIRRRYSGFLSPRATPTYQFEIRLDPPSVSPDIDTRVIKSGSVWCLERGDLRAEWDTRSRRGWVRQSLNPYSLDTVLRIVHSLVLAEEGGFLVHAASGLRHRRAFVFAGVSGAGKTTMAQLAPRDVTLLTDEISYIRRVRNGYYAYGTPFAGELARVGANVSAPLGGLYFLEKGPSNRIEPIEPTRGVQSLMRHILFFAHDRELVKRVFDSAVEFVTHMAVARFVFAPNERAWEAVS